MYLRCDNVPKTDRTKQRAYMYTTHTGFKERERGERGDICALSREALRERTEGGQRRAMLGRYNAHIQSVMHIGGIFFPKVKNVFHVNRFYMRNHFLDAIN